MLKAIISIVTTTNKFIVSITAILECYKFLGTFLYTFDIRQSSPLCRTMDNTDLADVVDSGFHLY